MKRLGVEPKLTPGGKGQFDVVADGTVIARRGGNVITRSLGMGYPEPEEVVDRLERHAARSDGDAG